MKELVAKLSKETSLFMQEAQDGLKPNAAAARRARKVSLDLEKSLKEYRKKSNPKHGGKDGKG